MRRLPHLVVALLLGLSVSAADCLPGGDLDDDDAATDDDDFAPDDDDVAPDDDDAVPTDVVGDWSGTLTLLQYIYKGQPPEEVCEGTIALTIDAAGALTGTGTCDVEDAGTATVTISGAVADAAGGDITADVAVSNPNNSWTSEGVGVVVPGGPLELTWSGWLVFDNGFWASVDGAVEAFPQ